MNFGTKKQSKKFFSSKLLFIVLFAVFILVSGSYAKGIYHEYKIEQEINQLKSEITELEDKKLESVEILSYVMSDQFLEEKARVELNMKKPGEQVVFFDLDEENSDKKIEIEQLKTLEEMSNMKKWWLYFTKKGVYSI